jgi:hypothetical protein
MYSLLANIINIIHLLIGVIVYIGVFLPEKYLIWYILSIILIHSHWQFNNGYCILTTIEYQLRCIPISAYYDSPVVKNFVKKILDKLNIKTDIDLKYIDNKIRDSQKLLCVIAIIRLIRWLYISKSSDII